MRSSPLTDLQVEALRLFFSLDESEGFVLAGGAGLLAVGLTSRPTKDLDLFCAGATSSVTAAADRFEARCREHGWEVREVQGSATFRRLRIDAGEDAVIVDLAVDAPPIESPTISAFGPTLAPRDLAARKILALYDRAALRDFVDVYCVAERFPMAELVVAASRIDEGLDVSVLADMADSLDRFTDDEIAGFGQEAQDIRRFFDRWSADLRTG